MVPPNSPGNTRSSSPVSSSRVASAARARGDVGHHRHRAHLAALRRAQAAVRVVAAAHANRLAGEVDVAPLQREQLAHAQAGERRGQEQGAVLLERPPRARAPGSPPARTRRGRRDADARAVDVGHGLRGRPHTFIARRKIPCRTTRCFWIVRFEPVRVVFQRSIGAGVTSSSRISPKASYDQPRRRSGSRRAWTACSRGRAPPTAATRPTRPRRSRRSAPSPAAARGEPGGSRSSSHAWAAALRELAGGRAPADVHAGPIELLDLAPVRAAGTWRTTAARGGARRGRRGRKWGRGDCNRTSTLGTYSGHRRPERPKSAPSPQTRDRQKPSDRAKRSGEGIEPSNRRATTACRF